MPLMKSKPLLVAATVLGCILVSTLAGVVWGQMIISTNSALGFVAWVLGFLCGYAAVILSRGHRGPVLQTAGVVATVWGVLVANYIPFFHHYKIEVGKKFGAMAVGAFWLLSKPVLDVYVESLPAILWTAGCG